MITTRISSAIAIVVAVVGGAAQAQTYDCTLQTPRSLRSTGDVVELRPIRFPGVDEGAWQFSVEIEKGDRNKLDQARVDWRDDPIQLAGTFPVLHTGKGAIVFNAYSAGPCMFTETACMTLVQIVDQPEGNAKILIQPAAMWSDRENDTRDPFVAVIEGTCTKEDS